MDKLVYKTFTWPQNPERYQQNYVREPEYTKNTSGDTVFSGMGVMKRTFTGSGCFTGSTAYAKFLELAEVFADAASGSLVHPIWGTYKCYFTELELTQEPRSDYVAYRFTFREADSSDAIPK